MEISDCKQKGLLPPSVCCYFYGLWPLLLLFYCYALFISPMVTSKVRLLASTSQLVHRSICYMCGRVCLVKNIR